MSQFNPSISGYLQEMRDHEETFIGFPDNLAYDWTPVASVSAVYLNNCGDPFSTLSWKKHSKFHEQEVVKYFLDLYNISHDDGWGYTTSGGTEGNMEGIFLGRETYPEAILYYSEDTHYSIGKIANILRVSSEVIPSQAHGEIDYQALETALTKNIDKPAIICVNCGTTVKGAYDDLDKVIAILKKLGITERYIHVDAALSGMIVPFLKTAPKYTFPEGIDSIAISMHKFFGCPIISGLVLARKKYVERIKQKIQYVNSHDTTISGSRNGQVPIYIWYLITNYGSKVFARDAKKCVENAKYLHKQLNANNYPAKLNKHSTTVYFKRPSEKLAEKWQLSCHDDIAHIVVMQHVNKAILDKFIVDLQTEIYE